MKKNNFQLMPCTFTERDGVITPLFFYYDKELHPAEYNNTTLVKLV